MLAKQYHFQYEGVKVLNTIKYDSKRDPQPYVCIEGRVYPLWNTELFIEIMSRLKQHIKAELVKNHEIHVLNNPDRVAWIQKTVEDTFKELKLRLVSEEGYKECFYFDPNQGEYTFDLKYIRKVNYIGNHPFRLHLIQYGEEEIDLAQLCPECWCGKWSRMKNSL